MKDWSMKVYPAPEPVSVDPCGCVLSHVDGRDVLVARCVLNMAASVPGAIVVDMVLVGVAV